MDFKCFLSNQIRVTSPFWIKDSPYPHFIQCVFCQSFSMQAKILLQEQNRMNLSAFKEPLETVNTCCKLRFPHSTPPTQTAMNA